jgi:peroxiredoxin
MKKLFAAILGTVVLLSSGQRAFTADATNELTALVLKVRTDLEAGKKTEADLADDLKQFDVLLAEHKGEKNDDVAQILVMKAMLYVEIIDNPEKGKLLLAQVKTDFPDSKWAKQADLVIGKMDQQSAAKKIKEALKVGTKFPDFSETDVDGKPMAIASYKGKVVLIDFWATWCGPCVAELPNVLATYQKHHAQGFDIIGVSLDEDKAKLTQFTKAKDMPWQQFFDGLVWSNKLAVKYGIESIPATFLLDGEGNIIGEDLRGEELEAAVAKAVAKK